MKNKRTKKDHHFHLTADYRTKSYNNGMRKASTNNAAYKVTCRDIKDVELHAVLITGHSQENGSGKVLQCREKNGRTSRTIIKNVK